VCEAINDWSCLHKNFAESDTGFLSVRKLLLDNRIKSGANITLPKLLWNSNLQLRQAILWLAEPAGKQYDNQAGLPSRRLGKGKKCFDSVVVLQR